MTQPKTPKLAYFYVFVLVVFMFFLIFEYLYVSKIPFAEEEVSSLSELQKKQLDMFLEMNHLLTSLATLSLAGMGAFVFNRYKSGQLPWYQIRRAVGSWVFSGLSLYSGYLSFNKILWMLQNQFFNLANPQISWPARAQFWTFVISIFLLADFVYRGIRKEETAEI